MSHSSTTLSEQRLPVIRAHEVLLPGGVLALRLSKEDLPRNVQRSAKVLVQQNQRSTAACIAIIVSMQPDGLGEEVVVFRGLSRAKVLAVDSANCCATYHVQLDYFQQQPSRNRNQLRQEILAILDQSLSTELRCLCSTVLRHEVPLGMLCDLAAQALQLGAVVFGKLLEESDVDARCDLVLKHAWCRESNSDTVLPSFSKN